MPDFKPLPMKDIANPVPMHPASEKMSQWMNSYMPTIMNKVMAGSVAPTNLGMGNETGAGISNMLFQSIHPDTFERVLNFIKPTSREEGGPVSPQPFPGIGRTPPNDVGTSAGPSPIIPGNIIPNSIATGELPAPLPFPREKILSPVGEDTGQLNSVPGYIARFLVDIGRVALGLPEGGQPPLPGGLGIGASSSGMGLPIPMGMSSLGAGTSSQGYRIAEGGKPEIVNAEGAYFPFERGQVTPLEPRQGGGDVIPGGPGIPMQYEDIDPATGLSKWGITKEGNTYTLAGEEGTMTVGPERRFMGTQEILPGQRQYPASEDRTVSGDELARQRIFRQTPPGGFYSPITGTVTPEDLRLPQRSYYEAHPEERTLELLKEAGEERPPLGMAEYEAGARKMRGLPPLKIAPPAEIAKDLAAIIGGKGETTTAPHYIQTDTGEVVAYKPPKNLPLGVPVSTGVRVRQPVEKDIATSGLREFEVATGVNPSMRGTPEYSKSYMEFLTGKKQATQITDPIQQKKLGTTLRKEFNSLQPVKDYRDIETRFNVMGKAIEESKTTKNFVAVDQALITIFNKMTDPQSVVRESEYLRTPQDLALWNRIKGKVSKMVAGGAGLTPDDRNALFSMAKQFQGAYESKYNQLRNEYRGYAVDYGLDPETVIKSSSGERTLVKQFYSESTKKTKYVYSDGTEEIK